jgi:hypothetical protein
MINIALTAESLFLLVVRGEWGGSGHQVVYRRLRWSVWRRSRPTSTLTRWYGRMADHVISRK